MTVQQLPLKSAKFRLLSFLLACELCDIMLFSFELCPVFPRADRSVKVMENTSVQTVNMLNQECWGVNEEVCLASHIISVIFNILTLFFLPP